MKAHLARLRRGAQLGRLVASVDATDRARVIRDFARTQARLVQAMAESPGAALHALAADVACMFRMLVDRRFRVSWGTTAVLVLALGYFVSPVDLIPDSIPVIGFLDDAALVAEVALLIAGDLRRFRAGGAERPVVVAVPAVSPASCAAAGPRGPRGEAPPGCARPPGGEQAARAA